LLEPLLEVEANHSMPIAAACCALRTLSWSLAPRAEGARWIFAGGLGKTIWKNSAHWGDSLKRMKIHPLFISSLDIIRSFLQTPFYFSQIRPTILVCQSKTDENNTHKKQHRRAVRW
jgi:hypothetical protein